jgi:hypothetical protein
MRPIFLFAAGCAALATVLGAGPAAANPLTNGGFEEIVGGFPADWGPFAPDFGPGTKAEIGPSPDAHSGKWSLRLSVTGAAHPTEMAGVNRNYPRDVQPAGRLDVRRGGFTFWYKVVRKGSGRPAVQVIAMGRSDVEDTGAPRITFDLPPEYAGDGQWHEGFLKFDFSDNDKVAWVQPALRINDGPAEFLVDDVAYVESLGRRLAVGELAIVEDAARPGEAGTLRAVVTNGGDAPAEGVTLAVGLPEGLRTEAAEKTIARLAPDAKATVEFPILGRRDKPGEVSVSATYAGGPPASRALEIAPGLEIVSFHAEPFVMEEHGNSTWIVVVRNPGNAIATGFKGVLDVPVGLHGEPIGDPLPGSLAPGQTISHRYRLTSERQAGRLMMGVKFNAGGLEASKEATLIICGDRPLIQPSRAAAWWRPPWRMGPNAGLTSSGMIASASSFPNAIGATTRTSLASATCRHEGPTGGATSESCRRLVASSGRSRRRSRRNSRCTRTSSR